MPTPRNIPVVSVLNMKGGVGKTTIAANIFKHIYDVLHKNVLLVDFDPQFNLSQALLSQQSYEKHKADGRTISQVMTPSGRRSLYDTTAPSPPPALADVSVLLRESLSSSKKISLVPGNFDLVNFSLIDDRRVLSNSKKRFVEFINQAKTEVDVICLDCNPSSSFMTQCAISVSTHIIVPVKPDKYSLQGLDYLYDFISNYPGLVSRPKFIVILNGIDTNLPGSIENELRKNAIFGPNTLANGLYMSAYLEARPNRTGFATDKGGPYSWKLYTTFTAITRELQPLLGI